MQSPLTTASTSTFEALGLLLPDAEPTAEQRGAPLARGVRVAFAGPFTGELTVRVSEDVATALAANMLGVHAVASEDRLVHDALGEVANVICGNLLPELAGRAAVFHLGAPEPVPVAGGPTSGPDRPSLAITLGVDAGRAEVSLHVDPADADTP